MSTKHAAKEPPMIDTRARFEWESEETLVDRRNKPLARINRFFRERRWLIMLGIILVAALFNAAVMRAVISVGQALFSIVETAFTPPQLGNSSFLQFVSLLLQIVIIVISFLFQFVIFFWLGARTRMYTIWPGQEGVSFKDYRGQPELLEQAQQIVLLLRGVRPFEKAGGEPLNGLLLEGPPGTGKTWLAQAISTEAGVPFFFVDASSLQGTFMGMGAIKVSRLYGKARRAAKDYGAAVIFMDEIDSIGARGGVRNARGEVQDPLGGGSMGGSMGLLSTLLIEMSGFSLEHGWRARWRTWWYKTILRKKPPQHHKRVLTIGATNRLEALDPALLRPGRFDKKLRVDAPDMSGRHDIFAYYLSKMSHDESMQPMILASETPGYTPADIKYLLNESLRYALFDGRRYMTYRDFQLAKPEHEMGMRAPIKHQTEETRRRIAYHEAGHAVAVRLFQKHHRIARITIIRQGSAYGHVSHYPASEAYSGLMTNVEWMNRLRVAAAGRAAEVEFCGLGEQTLGVGGDFTSIRNILTMMAQAGMLGPLGGTLGWEVINGRVSSRIPPEMLQAMDETFLRVLNETRIALREHDVMIKALVDLLLDKEEILADEVEQFFNQYGFVTPKATMIQEGVEVPILPA